MGSADTQVRQPPTPRSQTIKDPMRLLLLLSIVCSKTTAYPHPAHLPTLPGPSSPTKASPHQSQSHANIMEACRLPRESASPQHFTVMSQPSLQVQGTQQVPASVGPLGTATGRRAVCHSATMWQDGRTRGLSRCQPWPWGREELPSLPSLSVRTSCV